MPAAKEKPAAKVLAVQGGTKKWGANKNRAPGRAQVPGANYTGQGWTAAPGRRVAKRPASNQPEGGRGGQGGGGSRGYGGGQRQQQQLPGPRAAGGAAPTPPAEDENQFCRHCGAQWNRGAHAAVCPVLLAKKNRDRQQQQEKR